MSVSRREALAAGFGATALIALSAIKSAKAATPEISAELRTLLDRFAAADRAADAYIKAASAAGKDTGEDPQFERIADDREEAKLAVCSFRSTSEADRNAKGYWLRDVYIEGKDDLFEEDARALLISLAA